MSMLGKWKILVDTANLADGDSIAAYLTSASGVLFTNTTVGAKEALDVYQQGVFAEDSAHSSGDLGQSVLAVRNDAGTSLVSADGDYAPLQVDASGALRVNASIDFVGDYAEDSAHSSGDIGLFSLGVRRDTRSSGVSQDGDYASFNVNSVGELWVKDADSLAELVLANASLDAIEASVAQIDIDVSSVITELQAANTSLDAIEASVAQIDLDTSSIITELQSANTSLDNIESDVDAIRIEQLDQGTTLDSILSELQGLSLAEDAAHTSGDVGIQALAVRKDAAGASSTSADGDYSSLQTWSNGELKTVDIVNEAISTASVSVTNTAATIFASPLARRKEVTIQNLGNKPVFLGPSGVSASNGIRVDQGGTFSMKLGVAVDLQAVTASGTAELRIIQAA